MADSRDIRITSESRDEAVGRCRELARHASAAMMALVDWARAIEVKALRQEMGVDEPSDGRITGATIGSIKRTVSHPNYANPFLAAAGREIMGIIMPSEIEKAEERKKKSTMNKDRRAVVDSIDVMLDEFANRYGRAAAREVVGRVARWQTVTIRNEDGEEAALSWASEVFEDLRASAKPINVADLTEAEKKLKKTVGNVVHLRRDRS